RLQFVAPLLPQTGGGDDEDARLRSAGNGLSDDQPCLNRLAEPYFVSDQHSAGIAARDRDGGLELKRQHSQICPCRSPQRCPFGYGSGEDRTRSALPSLHRHEARRCRRRRREIDRLERQKEASPDAVVGRIASVCFNDGDCSKGRFGCDEPSFIPNLYRIADVQTELAHGSSCARAVPPISAEIRLVMLRTLRDCESG